MWYLRALIAVVALALPTASRADTCSDRAWIPETEQCLGLGASIHLNILRRSIDLTLARANRPSFYKIAVVRSGRSGAVSDSYVSQKPPLGREREWFAVFYVYVTPDYLAERNSYASLVRLGAQRVCESHYLDWPDPSSAEKAYERRETIEYCVYDAMKTTEQHYFTALAREIELGDEYLLQFKDMPYPALRDTIRARFGDHSVAAVRN